MTENASTAARCRHAMAGVAAILLAATLAACGSSAPATPSQAAAASVAPAPSVAPASVTPTTVASAPAASAPAASAPAATDPTVGLKIAPPYTLTALPAALQTTLETQMAAGLGAFGGSIAFGFRQVDGGSGTSILMVIGFPTGTLSATAYQAALTGMGSSLGATFTTSTVDGVDVANGKSATGGVAVFHIGDHMLVVIAPAAADSLPIATALIKANQ